MTVNKTTTLYASLPATTDEARMTLVRDAIERELTAQGGTAASVEMPVSTWEEIKERTLEEILSAYTDSLVDEYHDYLDEHSAVDVTSILTGIKVGSDALDVDYLSHCVSDISEIKIERAHQCTCAHLFHATGPKWGCLADGCQCPGYFLKALKVANWMTLAAPKENES